MTAVAKAAIWKAVHGERVACPGCGREMSRRTLRWKHLCRRPEMLHAEAAAERAVELQRRATEDFLRRLHRHHQLPDPPPPGAAP